MKLLNPLSQALCAAAFLLLQRLLDSKSFIEDLGSQDNYLPANEWFEVKMMVDVLQIPHSATISLQKQDLTHGCHFNEEKSCLN